MGGFVYFLAVWGLGSVLKFGFECFGELGLEIRPKGLRVQGLGIRVWGSGFRVQQNPSTIL